MFNVVYLSNTIYIRHYKKNTTFALTCKQKAMYSASVVFSAVDRISAPMKSIENNVNRLVSRFTGLSSVGSLIGGVGFIGAVHKAGEAIKSYDENLASLRAITGLTGAAFVPFKNEIEKIGMATNVAFADV